MDSKWVHPFERAGLGKAPFVVLGVSEDRGPKVVNNVDGTTTTCGAPGQPMGTCQYCYNGIAFCFHIKSSDGKRFIVGSECVFKSGVKEGDKDSKELVEKVKKLKRQYVNKKARERSKAKRQEEMARRVAEREEKAKAVRVNMRRVLDDNPGLESALTTCKHKIVMDIARRFEHYGEISDKQISLVMKIAGNTNNHDNEFINVPVVDGKQTVRGVVVSAKWVASGPSWSGNSSLKGLIIVETENGKWKTWGTIPSSVCDAIVEEPGYYDIEGGVAEAIKGRTIEFSAKVTVANDPKMSFFSNPTKGKVV